MDRNKKCDYHPRWRSSQLEVRRGWRPWSAPTCVCSDLSIELWRTTGSGTPRWTCTSLHPVWTRELYESDQNETSSTAEHIESVSRLRTQCLYLGNVATLIVMPSGVHHRNKINNQTVPWLYINIAVSTHQDVLVDDSSHAETIDLQVIHGIHLRTTASQWNTFHVSSLGPSQRKNTVLRQSIQWQRVNALEITTII